MSVIYKYRLKVTDQQHVVLPGRSPRILSVQYQYSTLTLWAIVDPDDQLGTKVNILIVGTGPEHQEIPEKAKHLATVQDQSGLVWHVFAIYP